MKILACILFVAACGGAQSQTDPQPQPQPQPDPQPAAPTNEELIAKGGELYGTHCAKCHGDAGQGTDKAPAVVGQGALPKEPRSGSKRTVQFVTAYDVGVYAMEKMPGDAPGTLKPEEYLAILAFDLNANGVELGDTPLSVEGLEAIVLHP
jgi:cytochrome c